VALDQDHDVVPFSSMYEDQIASAITAADKFIFVISPDSLASGPCGWELSTAEGAGKQIVPLLRRAVPDGTAIPAAVAKRNWIFFDADDKFDTGFRQLIQTLDTDLAWVTTHRQLQVRAKDWADGGAAPSKLLRGSDLNGAEKWLADESGHPATPPTTLQRRYLAASRRATTRTTRTITASLAAGLALALALAAIALVQRNHAQQEATAAQARQLAAEAVADLAVNPSTSLRLALRSTELDGSSQGTRALQLALADDHLRMSMDTGFGPAVQAVWDPDAELIAATGRGNTVQLWNPRTGKLLRTFGSLPRQFVITQLLYDPAGTLLAAIAGQGMVAVWNTATGRPVDVSGLNSAIDAEASPPFSPHGNFGVSLTGVWQPGTGNLDVYGAGLRVALYATVSDPRVAVGVAVRDSVDDLVFSPSGKKAFADLPGLPVTTQIIGFPGRAIPLQSGDGSSEVACWTPAGNELAVWDNSEAQDPNMRIFNAATGAPLLVRPDGYTDSAAACGVAWPPGPHEPGGSVAYVAAGDYQGEGTLIQASTAYTQFDSKGKPDVLPQSHEFTTLGLYGHTQRINSVAVSADGSYIATGSADGTVRVWEALTGRLVSTIVFGPGVNQVQFSPDGGLVLATLADGVVSVADSGVGEPAVPLALAGAGTTYALGFADQGREVFGLGETMRSHCDRGFCSMPTVTSVRALLWAAGTGQIVASYQLPAPPVMALPDSCKVPLSLYEQSAEGAIHGCDTASAAEFAGISVSPDGKLLAYATANAVVIRELRGSRTWTVPLSRAATGLAFEGQDDQLVVMTNAAVYVWQSGLLHRIGQPTAPADAELSADGTRLATANANGTATVWNVDTAKLIVSVRPHHADVGGYKAFPCRAFRVALDSRGSELAVGASCGTVDLWSVGTRKLIASRIVANAQNPPGGFPITDLQFSASGSSVLAANYPETGAGDTAWAGAGLVLAASSGKPVARLDTSAREIEGPAIDPGVAFSPDGDYILSGISGLAPVPAQPGDEAIYSLSGATAYLDLQNSVSAVPPAAGQTSNSVNLTPVNPWAPDGVRVLTGAPAIYACDACGSLPEMQAAARLRLAWMNPLTPGGDHPPGGNAFF
jgi:WD40 repeat protein